MPSAIIIIIIIDAVDFAFPIRLRRHRAIYSVCMPRYLYWRFIYFVFLSHPLSPSSPSTPPPRPVEPASSACIGSSVSARHSVCVLHMDWNQIYCPGVIYVWQLFRLDSLLKLQFPCCPSIRPFACSQASSFASEQDTGRVVTASKSEKTKKQNEVKQNKKKMTKKIASTQCVHYTVCTVRVASAICLTVSLCLVARTRRDATISIPKITK